jgi:hypothetical protein
MCVVSSQSLEQCKRTMLLLKFITLSSLLSLATGHVGIDERKGDQNVRGSYNDHDHRSLGRKKNLQKSWWNWNYCTNAYYNESFTSVNSLVPKGTVFLAGYPTFKVTNSTSDCKKKTITRKGTVGTGNLTIFFPLANAEFVDYEDDWKLGKKDCAASLDETVTIRFGLADAKDEQYNGKEFKKNLFASVDGNTIKPFYLYDKDKFYFDACDDKRTNKEYSKLGGFPDGDTCDDKPFQAIGGVDAYPLLGWYGRDTRNWSDGETHTYEFGSLSQCITAKYILKAKRKN